MTAERAPWRAEINDRQDTSDVYKLYNSVLYIVKHDIIIIKRIIIKAIIIITIIIINNGGAL